MDQIKRLTIEDKRMQHGEFSRASIIKRLSKSKNFRRNHSEAQRVDKIPDAYLSSGEYFKVERKPENKYTRLNLINTLAKIRHSREILIKKSPKRQEADSNIGPGKYISLIPYTGFKNGKFGKESRFSSVGSPEQNTHWNRETNIGPGIYI